VVRKRKLVIEEAFLSHSSKDRKFTAKLAAVLREHGVNVWYSEHAIRGAQQWHDEIGAALERCDWMIVVMSPAAVKSKWVKRELLFALDDPRYQDRVVPALAKACDTKKLSWVLAQLQMISFTDFKEGCRELLNVWGIRYRS
jgi:hypothetical protein